MLAGGHCACSLVVARELGDTGERAKDDSRSKGKGQEESALNRTRGTTVCGQRHPGVQRHGPQESCAGGVCGA